MSSDTLPAERDRAQSWRQRWFAGITRNGVALVALACLANALSGLTHFPPDVRLAGVAQVFGRTAISMTLTMLVVVATINRVPSAPRWRYPALGLAILVSTAVGILIRGLIAAGGWSAWLAETSANGGIGWWLYGSLLFYGGIFVLFAAVFVFYRLREEHESATRRAELARARSEQQMDEARLSMLQAQIEPHFLFNTLANVRRLYQTEPSAGGSMLQNLMRYLAVALPQMRASDSTLGREATLTESYLEIQRTRMGRRLAFEIDVPASLRDIAIPPMMLITLVENAIKHGINPLSEGGFVRVGAQLTDGQLCLQVADSGQGFTKTSGGGTGLANIRARLAGLYGRAARLTLAVNTPRGVTATIVLPYPAINSGTSK